MKRISGAMTLGTPEEKAWVTFGRHRGLMIHRIQPAPANRDEQIKTARPPSRCRFTRARNRGSGTESRQSSRADAAIREQLVIEQSRRQYAGFSPAFFKTIHVSHRFHGLDAFKDAAS